MSDQDTPQDAAVARVDVREQLDQALRPYVTSPQGRLQLVAAVLPVLDEVGTHCCEDGDRTYAEMERHLTQRAEQAESALARVRAFSARLRYYCSPHGVATRYAQQLDEILDQPAKEGE